MSASSLILALDTATRNAILALGTRAGDLVDAESWDVGHRHAEELLGRLDGLLGRNGLGRPDLHDIAAVAVGTGPGAFTGLRVGIATAKGLARAFGVPLVGVPTGAALLHAASNQPAVLLLPAGPADLYVVTPDGCATFLPGSAGQAPPAGPGVLAVDLPGRADADALLRGDQARRGLPGALLRLAAERLAAGLTADPALLVPEYVTLPRGLRGSAEGEVAWSPSRP